MFRRRRRGEFFAIDQHDFSHRLIHIAVVIFFPLTLSAVTLPKKASPTYSAFGEL